MPIPQCHGTWKRVISLSQGLFDIQMATVSNYSPGTVNVSCTFARHSRALGCLVVLHPQNTSQTEMFAYAARDNSSAPTANISIHGVPKGSHTVLVFDGEQNGLLSARAAAVQNVTVAEGGPEPARSNTSPYACMYTILACIYPAWFLCYIRAV